MPLFFCRWMLPIFVLRSKRKDMLKGITWGQYSVFILLVTAGYYLYIGLRFWGKGIISGSGSRKSGSIYLKRVPGRAREGNEGGGPSAVPGSDQAELFDEGDKVAAGNEMFKAMQHAIGVVRELIAWAVENKLDRENLLDHLHEALSKYRHLRGTDYAGTINNYLVRVCSSEFSLQLGEAELAELWK
jgi:hypothetical protein